MSANRPFVAALALTVAISVLAGPLLGQTVPTTRPDLASAEPGDLVTLPFVLSESVPTLPVEVTPAEGPPLLFSDSPEYFPGDGIALREEFAAGTTRFMIYHCPEATGRRVTITAVIDNLGQAPMRLRFPAYSFPTPSLNYAAIGRQGMIDFLSRRTGPAERVIPPGGRVVLDEAMDATIVTKDQLVHAFGELEASQPGRLTVLQRPADARSLDVVGQLPTLARRKDGAGRGTFRNADRLVTTTQPVDIADGTRQIVFADGHVDSWLTGHDAIDGQMTTNKGNYGLVYRLQLKLGSSDGRRVALLLAKPQEDVGYCPAATAAVVLRVGNAPPQIIPLPRSGVLRRDPPQGALIGVVSPPRGGTVDVELTYTPPAASCLPTPILLMPVD